MKRVILGVLIVLALVSPAAACETCYQNECSLTLMSGECNCRLKTGNCIGDVCGLQWCITYGGSCDWWAYCPDDGGSGGTPPPIRRKVVAVEASGADAELVAGIVRALIEEPRANGMTTEVAGRYIMAVRNRIGGAGDFVTVNVVEADGQESLTVMVRDDGGRFVAVPVTSGCPAPGGRSLARLEEYSRCALRRIMGLHTITSE